MFCSSEIPYLVLNLELISCEYFKKLSSSTQVAKDRAVETWEIVMILLVFDFFQIVQ